MTGRPGLLLLVVYAGLVVGGWFTGQWLIEPIAVDVHPSNEAQVHRAIILATAVYVLAAAVPFVPGAEIGFALIAALGTPIALLVYASMVAALMLSYTVGRLIPARITAAAFGQLGLARARGLVLHMGPLDATERLEVLTANAPRRIIPFLLRHRFIAVAVVINLPGNTLLGGGGGIALAAGLSGLYPLPAFLATILIAVAPLPLIVLLTGYVP